MKRRAVLAIRYFVPGPLGDLTLFAKSASPSEIGFQVPKEGSSDPRQVVNP